jgi:alpha-N-acetylglucosamine transferase
MRKRYYKDDIIEIINGSEVGQRFYVKYLFGNNKDQMFSLQTDMAFHPKLNNVKLYYRPFKNYFKSLINIFFH